MFLASVMNKYISLIFFMQKIEAKDSSQKEFRAGSIELQDTESMRGLHRTFKINFDLYQAF